MPAPPAFSEANYLELSRLFGGGDISTCSKRSLERFAVMLSRPNAFTHFGAASFPQICETVRTLLVVRMSEEQNEQAKRESRLALIIACIALLAGIVQAVASIWPLVFPLPTLVQSDKPLPIHAPEPIGVYAAPIEPRPQAAEAQGPSKQLPTRPAPPPSAASKGASK